MYQVLNEPPQQATRLNPRLPPELDALFDKALAKFPDARFQDADEFIRALENLRLVEREIAADGSTVIRVEPVRTPEPPSQLSQVLPGWDATLLAQAERLLVEILGPVARLLVRKTAQQVGSPKELAEKLAEAIPGEQDRLLFQRRMRGVIGGTMTGTAAGSQGTSLTGGSQVSASMGPFDQNFLESVRRDLAVYLGPIAKLLIKQTAGKANTPQELYQRLAEHIPTAADRAAFLKRAPDAG